MANNSKPEIGTVTWFDLTVDNADEVKDFYNKVVGLEIRSGKNERV